MTTHKKQIDEIAYMSDEDAVSYMITHIAKLKEELSQINKRRNAALKILEEQREEIRELKEKIKKLT